MESFSFSNEEIFRMQELFYETLNVEEGDNTPAKSKTPKKESKKSAAAKPRMKNSPNLKENKTPSETKKKNTKEVETPKSRTGRKKSSTRQPLKVLTDNKEIPKVSPGDISEKESPFSPGALVIKKETFVSPKIIIYEDVPMESSPLPHPDPVNFRDGFPRPPARSKPKDIPGRGRKTLAENSRKSVLFVVPPNDAPDANADKKETELLSSIKSENPKKKSLKPSPEELNYAVLTLEAAFPDADPEYLRAQCIKHKGSFRDTAEAIVAKEKAGELPSRADYLKRQETEKLEKRYWEKFSVENYLKIIPNPWDYFLVIERHNCARYSGHGFHYLKNKFKKHYTRVIQDAFARNDFSLYLTNKELEKKHRHLKMRATNRSKAQCNAGRPITFDIQFMHEVAFVEYESQIKARMKKLERAKYKKFKQAEKAGTLLACQYCKNPNLLVDEAVACPANHVFCTDCIVKFVNINPNLNGFHFGCLLKCPETFQTETLKEALCPGVMAKIIESIPPKETKPDEFEYLLCCPFCYCIVVLPESVTVLRCPNPDCMLESCRYCKQLNHLPEKCKESNSFDLDVAGIEEQLFEHISKYGTSGADNGDFEAFDSDEIIGVNTPNTTSSKNRRESSEEKENDRNGTLIFSAHPENLEPSASSETSSGEEFEEAAKGGEEASAADGHADSSPPTETLQDLLPSPSQDF